MKRFILSILSVLLAIVACAEEFPSEDRDGIFVFDTKYLADVGSRLSDDTVHVALVKTSTTIPDATSVLVYARPTKSTSAGDWFELLPRLTIADFPHDYPLANAKKHNILVTANYVPETPAETNKLLQISAKIQLRITPTSSLPIVIPKTTIIKE